MIYPFKSIKVFTADSVDMNAQILPNTFIKGMVLCLIYLLYNSVLTIKIIYFTPGMESRAHLFIPVLKV